MRFRITCLVEGLVPKMRLQGSAGFSLLPTLIALVILGLAMFGVIYSIIVGQRTLQSVEAAGTFDSFEMSLRSGVFDDVKSFWIGQAATCSADPVSFSTDLTDVLASGLNLHLPADVSEWDNLSPGFVGGQGQAAMKRCRAAISPVGSAGTDLSATTSLYFCLMISADANASPAVTDAFRVTKFAFGEFYFYFYDTTTVFPSMVSCQNLGNAIQSPNPALIGYLYYGVYWATAGDPAGQLIYQQKFGVLTANP